MEKTQWAIIGRTRNGWHAEGRTKLGRESVTTYSNSKETLDRLAREAAEGALVYDMTGVDEDLAVRFVISGPMIDPSLKPGEVDRFGKKDREAAAAMLPGLSGGFDTLARAAQNPKFSGLDSVAPDVYIALVKKLPGSRVGRVEGGAVVWE